MIYQVQQRYILLKNKGKLKNGDLIDNLQRIKIGEKKMEIQINF